MNVSCHRCRMPCYESLTLARVTRGGLSRDVDKVVAQVSQPAVSQGFQPADAANPNTLSDFGRDADWKSAIQQVGNLRYVLAARRHGVLIDFANGPARASAAGD
ncbi:MAG: hypothetical protein HY674_20485 [Chloroflexi bacterium]|nr:hypothetical protein [Chloroflexota bacterium]